MPNGDDFECQGDNGEINHPLPPDLMFDQWATLSGQNLMSFADGLTQQVIGIMHTNARKPRSDLVAGVSSIVHAIIANLIILHGNTPGNSGLAVQMKHTKKTRYDRPGFRKFPEVVRALAGLGYLSKRDAVFRFRRTTIEATGTLKKHLLQPDVSPSSVIRVEGEETIQLTARPVVSWIGGKKQPNARVDYEDTEHSIKLRAEMEEINSFLNQQRIELEGTPTPAFCLTRRFSLRHPDGSRLFNLHGRLYGGFWMGLKASERHRLRINGEPVADLDFSNMFPRLAYSHVQQEPPEGDLYAIPGLEGHREGAKAGLSALLSYRSDMKALPSRLKVLLPDGWTASHLSQACVAHHPGIASLFGRDFGLDLMFTESRILTALLLKLSARGIPALPMHDGVMVPETKTVVVVAAMREVSREVVGVELPVTQKPIWCV